MAQLKLWSGAQYKDEYGLLIKNDLPGYEAGYSYVHHPSTTLAFSIPSFTQSVYIEGGPFTD